MSVEFDPTADGLWDVNSDGAWCPACGDIIATDYQLFRVMDTDWEPPTTCRQCGYPDFEDGAGYFTGE